MGCSRDYVEITESSESRAMIPDEQAIATKSQVVGHRPEHPIKRRSTQTSAPAGAILGSLLKRRDAPRCFFSLAELRAISSFEDSPDDGGYWRFSGPS